MSLISRGNSMSGDNSSMTSDSGTVSNPMFKVKLRSLETEYEQGNGSQKKNDDEGLEFTIGDIVSGKSINGNDIITGKVINIHKNEQQIISYVEIINQKNMEKVKLDPNSCSIKDKNDSSNKKNQEMPQQKLSYSAESLRHLISYDDFKLTDC